MTRYKCDGCAYETLDADAYAWHECQPATVERSLDALGIEAVRGYCQGILARPVGRRRSEYVRGLRDAVTDILRLVS